MKFAFLCGVLAIVFGLAVGCDESAEEPRDTEIDGGSPARDKDGSTKGPDAATQDAEATGDAGSDAEERTDSGGAGECFFNADCPSSLRCECDESTGCSCQPGTRGTGVPGAPCANGNDCASSICIDTIGAKTCSGPCNTESDCPPELPQCLFIFDFPEKICSPE